MLAKVSSSSSLLLLLLACASSSSSSALEPHDSGRILIPTGANGLRPTTTRSNTGLPPPAKRSDISSDAVVGFDTTVPDDTEGTLMEAWWPYLYVVDGCVPFPAVDAEGDTKFVFSKLKVEYLFPEPCT